MQHEIEFVYRDLIKDPLSKEEIEGLSLLAGIGIDGLINKRSQIFKKLNISLNDISADDIFRLLKENPRIIIRPILTDGKQILFRFKESEYKGLVGDKK